MLEYKSPPTMQWNYFINGQQCTLFCVYILYQWVGILTVSDIIIKSVSLTDGRIVRYIKVISLMVGILTPNITLYQ